MSNPGLMRGLQRSLVPIGLFWQLLTISFLHQSWQQACLSTNLEGGLDGQIWQVENQTSHTEEPSSHALIERSPDLMSNLSMGFSFWSAGHLKEQSHCLLLMEIHIGPPLGTSHLILPRYVRFEIPWPHFTGPKIWADHITRACHARFSHQQKMPQVDISGQKFFSLSCENA